MLFSRTQGLSPTVAKSMGTDNEVFNDPLRTYIVSNTHVRFFNTQRAMQTGSCRMFGILRHKTSNRIILVYMFISFSKQITVQYVPGNSRILGDSWIHCKPRYISTFVNCFLMPFLLLPVKDGPNHTHPCQMDQAGLPHQTQPNTAAGRYNGLDLIENSLQCLEPFSSRLWEDMQQRFECDDDDEHVKRQGPSWFAAEEPCLVVVKDNYPQQVTVYCILCV